MTRWWHWLWRDGAFLRYLLVGAFTSALDLSLFTTLVAGAGWHPVLANVASTTITICVSYFINRTFVFAAKEISVASFFSFAAVTLFTGLVLQSGVIWVGGYVASSLGADPRSASVAAIIKAVAMALGALCNYLAYSFVFRKRIPPEGTGDPV